MKAVVGRRLNGHTYYVFSCLIFLFLKINGMFTNKFHLCTAVIQNFVNFGPLKAE